MPDSKCGSSKIIRGVLELHYLGGPLARRKIVYIDSPFSLGSFSLWSPPCCPPFLFTLFWSCQWRRRRAGGSWASSTLLCSPVRGCSSNTMDLSSHSGSALWLSNYTFQLKSGSWSPTSGSLHFLFFCRWTRIKLKIFQYQSVFITHKTARVLCVCVCVMFVSFIHIHVPLYVVDSSAKCISYCASLSLKSTYLGDQDKTYINAITLAFVDNLCWLQQQLKFGMCQCLRYLTFIEQMGSLVSNTPFVT